MYSAIKLPECSEKVRRILTLNFMSYFNRYDNKTLMPYHLINYKQNFSTFVNCTGEPIVAAIRTGSVKIVKHLLDHGADISTVKWRNYPLIGGAVYNDHLDLLDYLIERFPKAIDGSFMRFIAHVGAFGPSKSFKHMMKKAYMQLSLGRILSTMVNVRPCSIQSFKFLAKWIEGIEDNQVIRRIANDSQYTAINAESASNYNIFKMLRSSLPHLTFIEGY